MAISTAFKQQCPSCEAFVPVKDSSMVGKKIDCPKCKYRFVVEAPAEKESEPAAETKPAQAKAGTATMPDKTRTAMQEKGKPKANGQAVKGAAPVKANGKAVKTKPDAKKPAEETAPETSGEDFDAATAKAKTSITKNKKLMLGLGLAGVGVVILGVAGFVIMNKGPSGNTKQPIRVNQGQNAAVNPQGAGEPEPEKKDGGKGKETKAAPPKVQVPDEPQLGAAGPEFTNLLPNDSEHVLHVYFKNVFDDNSPIREVAFLDQTERAPAALLAFSADDLRRKLGLPVLAIDDLLRAENFTVPWTFTILHTTRPVNQDELVRALDLEAVKTPIAGQTYFVAKKPLPWLHELGQLGLGAPEHLRALRERRKDQPLYVHVHGENRQVVIFADEAPLATFLQNGGRFKYRTELPAEAEPAPARPQPGRVPMPPGLKLPPGVPSDVQAETFQQPLPPGIPKADDGGAKPGQPMPPEGAFPPGVKPPAGSNTPPMPPAGPSAGAKVPVPTANPVVPVPQLPQMPPAGDALGGNTYMTIKRTLKSILDSLEKGQPGDKVYFSTATNMNAARLVSKDPDFQDHLLWHYRRFWDVTHLLQERTNRIHYLGVTLHQKKKMLYEKTKPSFRYKNEIICSTAEQAKTLEQDLIQQGAPRVVRFFDAVLARQKLDLRLGTEPAKANEQRPPGQEFPGARPGMPRSQPGMPGQMPGPGQRGPGQMVPGQMAPGQMAPGGMRMPPSSGGGFPPGGGGFPGNPSGAPSGGFGRPGMGGMPPGMPGGGVPGGMPSPPGGPPRGQANTDQPDAPPPSNDELTSSRITIRSSEERVEFILDVILDSAGYTRLYTIAGLFVQGLKSQLDLAEGKSIRHLLGKAGKDLGINGLSSRLVPAGIYPPGAFRRPDIYRSGRDPSQRVSWMAGLLPYLGREDLYRQINFDHSWREPSNWLAGHILVPEFLDPSYPLGARRVLNPDLPLELAATHYVGIAGVGLDAADYLANDPALDFKRGILGYESSRGLKEVAEHGLSNTILLIQTPHDGPAGVTPWIAGGGSTLRGVPEKNSIEPFVLSTDKDGKAITYNGKRGTYALMADGSARFIDAKVSDEVFKAMCTAKGPAPEKSSLTDWAPEVPPPGIKKAPPPAPPAVQEQTVAPKTVAPKTGPASKGPAQKQAATDKKTGANTPAPELGKEQSKKK